MLFASDVVTENVVDTVVSPKGPGGLHRLVQDTPDCGNDASSPTGPIVVLWWAIGPANNAVQRQWARLTSSRPYVDGRPDTCHC